MREASSDYRNNLSPDLIEKIVFSKNCAYEAMRLETPVATTGWAYLVKPAQIGGVTFTPDVATMINIHAVQRDPQQW